LAYTENVNIYFPPGDPNTGYPLYRFLPPMPAGSVSKLLDNLQVNDDCLVDFFGTSPQMLIEAAAAGRTVLVSSTNPILRFLIRNTAQPFTHDVLQAALTRLGNLPKDGNRLENFLKGLYLSRCEHCGAEVIADSFIWEAGRDVPSYKQYRCLSCQFSGETAAGVEDARLALEQGGYPQHREMVLTRIAPPGDPYRKSAAEALEIYSPRALIALDVLLNKLDQLQLDEVHDRAVRALYLTAFDRCSLLWSYPQGSRQRPRQISLSPRYYEHNVWQALLWSVDIWAQPDYGIGVKHWEPGDGLEPGIIHVYAGSGRNLIPLLAEMPRKRMLSVLPRPNQAFWSLSALWSAWTLGKEESHGIMRSLLRRRFDWNWYAGALQGALKGLSTILSDNRPAVVLMLEAEPAFTSSVFAGFTAAGFQLCGSACHDEDERAVLVWNRSGSGSGRELDPYQVLKNNLTRILLQRGEPMGYFKLACCALGSLAKDLVMMSEADHHAGNLLARNQKELSELLEDRRIFQRLDRHLELESGIFWLQKSEDAEEPLGDRVERNVFDILSQGEVDDQDLVERIFQLFPVLLPENWIIHSCAESYAERRGFRWTLREEERQERREEDCRAVTAQVCELGDRLGLEVECTDRVSWRDQSGSLIRVFLVSSFASLGPILQAADPQIACFVFPGSRSELILERMRRDPRFQKVLDQGARIMKFRQMRRLAGDPAVQRINYQAYLDLDPLGHQDPQIRLL
jgi:hypothetical protein